MKNKIILFLALLFLVSIISISAVSAADDSTSDISVAEEDQDLILEEENQDLITEENIKEKILTNSEIEEPVLTSKNDDGHIASSSKNAKLKEKTKKSSSKNKVTFKTISKGSKDKATVKKIQKALKKNGYYLRYKGHYLKVDGWFGPCTERSVRQFQKAKKLKVTGKVDEKTAERLKVIDKSNAKIKFENDKTFKGEYNSGKSFDVKIVKRNSHKGIETILRVDYYKNGKRINHEYYCTDEDGKNYITPDGLGTGTYKAKVSCDEPNIKAEPKYKTIVVEKTSIILKAKGIKISGNQNIQLKANLKFKNNAKVNEGKVKFTIDGKSYIVKAHNGVATKNLKLNGIKSNKYQVTFLGTKNIKAKSVSGKIS